MERTNAVSEIARQQGALELEVQRRREESQYACSHRRDENACGFAPGLDALDGSPALVFFDGFTSAICQRCQKFIDRKGNEKLFADFVAMLSGLPHPTEWDHTWESDQW